MDNENKIFEITGKQREQLFQELASLFKEKTSLQQEIREQTERETAIKEELLLEILEVFDALEFLINYVVENPEPTPQFTKRLPKSLQSVQKKLLTILKRREVSLIELNEMQLDFNLCRVVDREIRNDLEAQTITKIVRQGFQSGDKVLRPVEVITSEKED